MRWPDALARLEVLLAEERAAIRKLDAQRVLELALEKEQLIDLLRRAPPPAPAPKAPAAGPRPPAPGPKPAAFGPKPLALGPKPLALGPKPPAPEPGPPAARLRQLADDLRRNAVLLAHARDCIRDVVAGPGAALPAPPGRPAAAPPGRRMSVTGLCPQVCRRRSDQVAMSNLLSLLSVARDALSAQSAGLDVAGRNVANATTPGYSRRIARLESLGADGGVSGGVRYAGEGRASDRLLERRLASELGRQGAAEARAGALRGVESSLFVGGTFPVSKGLNDLASAWSKLAQTPSDASARAAALSSAGDLATRVSDAATALRQASNDVAARAGDVASAVNGRLSQIASLNGKIAAATGAGESAGDLRDRRDALAREVAERTGATAVEDAAGSLTLLAGGVSLVEGGRAAELEAGLDASGALVVSARRGGSPASPLKADLLGGSLGGLQQAYAKDVAPLRASLNQLAGDIAAAFNAEHAAGVGADGTGGRALFAFDPASPDPASTFRLDPAVAGRPEALAASSAGGAAGDGSAALRLADVAYQASAGGASLADRLAGFAGGIGTAIASADAEASLRADTVAQADAARESLVGVSIEEEMVAMTRFQRAFEASTRVLRAADELLSDFLRGI